MLDFSSSRCTLCQLVSVPIPRVFSQRGSFEGDFPKVQSSRNVTNFPSKFYSDGSILLCLLCHLLLTQMKEEEGWHGGRHSLTAGCLSIAFPHRVGICNVLTVCASGLAWGDVADNLRGRFILLKPLVSFGLPGKWAPWEWLLAHGTAQCSCASWVRCFRQTRWMSAWPTEIC